MGLGSNNFRGRAIKAQEKKFDPHAASNDKGETKEDLLEDCCCSFPPVCSKILRAILDPFQTLKDLTVLRRMVRIFILII